MTVPGSPIKPNAEPEDVQELRTTIAMARLHHKDYLMIGIDELEHLLNIAFGNPS